MLRNDTTSQETWRGSDADIKNNVKNVNYFIAAGRVGNYYALLRPALLAPKESRAMSIIFEAAIRDAAEKVFREFVSDYDKSQTDLRRCGPTADEKRRIPKMSWMDFSDAELRIVDEVEKNPGMKQNAIVSLMSVHDEAYPDGTCEAGTVRVLLANLVKRKVLIASSTNGYTINDSDYPPAKRYLDR